MPLKKKKKPTLKKRAAPKLKKKKIIRAVAKKPVKKVIKKKSAAKRKTAAAQEVLKEPVVGVVTHYFPHVKAAVVKMKKELSAGDDIRIKGHTTDFKQQVTSLQIDRQPIDTAKKGQEIGLMVKSRVRQHDLVYKL
ncbi:MAG: hypothetical protein Q8O22_01430 [Candidatus Omnitrophota bacterium]|nr:hypothetical protein [Candidatus Omnitrophota bacterium]